MPASATTSCVLGGSARGHDRGGVGGDELRRDATTSCGSARDAIAAGGNELRLGGSCEGASATAGPELRSAARRAV